MLHRTRFPLKTWFDTAWHVCEQKNGISALGLQPAMGFGSYHTAWEWLHRMRGAMVDPGRGKLNGEVEVDETFVGGVMSGSRLAVIDDPRPLSTALNIFTVDA